MPLIDLTEELTFKIKHYDDSVYEQVLEQFFDTLGYCINVVDKASKNHAVGINSYIVMLNHKKSEFTVEIPETFPNIIFKLKKSKSLKLSANHRDEILSFVLSAHTFVAIAKRIKTFLDLEKESVGKNAEFKEGFVYFNLKGVELFVDPVQKLTEEFNIKFETVTENGQLFFKVPVERLMQLGYTNTEISTIMHLIISAFKYVYTVESCGQDFIKRCQLKAELEKWKNTAIHSVDEILKNR